MYTKLTAQEALKLFHLWENLIISGELPNPKRFNQDFLKFYGGGEIRTSTLYAHVQRFCGCIRPYGTCRNKRSPRTRAGASIAGAIPLHK